MNGIAGDDEIVEIFVEEAGEVFQDIDRNLPIWSRQLNDKHALTEIRRGFHTLKGSGRMVNALDLSDLAWKVENMLNRVIDGTVQVTDSVVEIVASARRLMPRMLEAFQHHRPIEAEAEIETLTALADALAAGKTPSLASPKSGVTPTAGGDQGVAVNLDRRLERFQQRADEALHRSEMALQQTRKLATQLQALDGDAQDRVSRAEVNPIIERVNLLAKEVLDLHREAKRSQVQQVSFKRETNQLVDHRVRERVAPIERQRNQLERELSEARRVAAGARRLGWWALILSILLGGGAAIAVLSILKPTFG